MEAPNLAKTVGIQGMAPLHDSANSHTLFFWLILKKNS